ncbi:glycosyltransferase [Asticcacaulis taihuensis]|uniref:Glycosyltransferase involved in cell wall bisynthesis n=1 Tax=Asticcacaulis taihuensis TaxID=260084 RepID=A0A1G4SD11_9CAUL|nr:glycosyltransferase [Asticcacaulis taihuensis]SCW67112.1 Glycosyltransferase involved in cell wall bisynthesis [Asticcacaulis taihuensis]
MKVAIVHYWLVGMRGGEKVLECLCELYPEADIFTLVVDRGKLSPTLLKHRITTSFLQKIGGKRFYQKMLPLMPQALEAFDLSGYDLILSSEAGPAKGIIPPPDSVHICYCHSPMRYIWDLYPQYYRKAGWLARLAMRLTSSWLRAWDVTTSARVDHFIANSSFVAKRIEKFYRREAAVIHPPVDVSRFEPADTPEDYYLCAGQITPYKRIDVAIEACTRLNKRLVIIGSGATREMKRQAGPTITFLDKVDDEAMARHFRNCRALLFPGVEDFGIVPLEVMASGRPVLAYRRGGAVETVVENQTGMFFNEQTAESLMDVIGRFEARLDSFNPAAIRQHAQGWTREIFKERLQSFIASQLGKAA